MLNRKVAIDLGTANSLVNVSGRGIVLNEPTVVAITIDDGKVVAVGNEAKKMLGRTPEMISALRPLKDGVIADYAVTEAMIKYFLLKALGRVFLFKPDVMISVPSGVTSVEARAVRDAAVSAGAKNAHLIPEPLAAAIGAKIPVGKPMGNMIVNIGGGTTEVAIISLGGMVVSGSARVAGNKIDEAIASYIRRKYSLVAGISTCEKIKIEIGSAYALDKKLTMEVKGRDSIGGLPRTIELNSTEVSEAIRGTLNQIVSKIKEVLEKTPPELSSDIMDKGMVLSGGTALLRNIDKFITDETGVPAHSADNPLLCTVKGIGVALENLEEFGKSIKKK